MYRKKNKEKNQMSLILNDSKKRRTKRELKVKKTNFYLCILNSINNGLNPKQISKRNNKSEQNINHYISVLKKKGLIRKIAYGTWKLTKRGKIARTKGFSQGSSQARHKIEIWRMGYRFLIEHDNDIPDLKRTDLKNRGYVYRGHVLNCWVMKGKEHLDIYGTVSKSDKLWNAVMLAMTELIACKNYIEDKYHLLLNPLSPLKPDIIINTPETKKVAEKVYNELGRIRTEYFDIDTSKTGKPEFEAKDIVKAQNVIDNIGVENKAEKIIAELKELNPVLSKLTAQIKLHLKVQRKTLKVLDKMEKKL
jgi:hypothetical protein